MEKKKFDFRLLLKRVLVFVVLFALFIGIFYAMGSCIVANASPLDDVSTVVFDVLDNEWYEGSFSDASLNLPPPFANALDLRFMTFYESYIDLSDGDDISSYIEAFYYGSMGSLYVAATVGPDFWQSFNLYKDYFNQTSLDYMYYTLGSSEGYQNGLTAGGGDFSAGYNAGKEFGHGVGFSEGVASVNADIESIKSESFEAGFRAGSATEAANEHVGIRYIWAIASIPISTLASIFNFDILGINIFAIVTGLFSILLVVWVIKKVI